MPLQSGSQTMPLVFQTERGKEQRAKQERITAQAIFTKGEECLSLTSVFYCLSHTLKVWPLHANNYAVLLLCFYNDTIFFHII